MDVVQTQRKMARRTRSVEIQDSTWQEEMDDPPATTSSSSSIATSPLSPMGHSNSNNNDNHRHRHTDSPLHNIPSSTRRVPPPPRKTTLRFPRLPTRRSTSEPPRRSNRRRLLEDHFRVEVVDKERRVVLPGVPRYEEDWARDCHDYFNLIVLLPVIILNIMNWNWDRLLYAHSHVIEAWTGEWFHAFFAVTALYFIVDLLWILLVPHCVKSPATIIQHHIATILYISIPYSIPEYRWCMGACMSVEINTWFLIARRVLNKQGFSPWNIDLSFLSIRVKLISICFYLTWITIRCILYPALMGPFYRNWIEYTKRVGTPWNIVMLCIPLHAAFCLLNLKWSYDLLMSKVRYWRRKGQYHSVSSKGL